ncbi:MAG: hypothetical protein AB4040_02700 [Synechococcus sp.]
MPGAVVGLVWVVLWNDRPVSDRAQTASLLSYRTAPGRTVGFDLTAIADA